MSDALLIAIIPSIITLIGVIITNIFTNFNSEKKRSQENNKMINDIRTENTKVINDIKLEITAYHSSTDEKIKELTREVREHNNFAKRMPVVENEIKHIEEEIRNYHKDAK